jgi:hypothetical protein
VARRLRHSLCLAYGPCAMNTSKSTAFTLLVLCGFVLSGAHQVVAKPPVVRTKPAAEQKPGKPPASEKSKSSKKEDNLGPIGVFADIEAGWSEEKVSLITKHFGDKKVNISLDGGRVGGAFSRSQSHYLLKDLFEYTITERFEFVQYRNVTDGKAKVYAVAERSYKRNDDGRLFSDKIYVSLHQEKDRWVISEIKSVR